MKKTFSISVAGTPPFSLLARHLAQDEDFKEDARRLLDLEADRFESLAAALQAHESFLTRQALEAIVSDKLSGVSEVNEISRATWRLAELLRESDVSMEKTLEILSRTFEDHLEGFSGDERHELSRRIHELCVAPTGFDLQKKAERLSHATGKELDQLQIICDVRPVFNEDRTKIEGAMPVTLMRLDIDDNGTSTSVELRLSEEQLKDLEEKVASARRKLTTITALLVSASVTVPTITED